MHFLLKTRKCTHFVFPKSIFSCRWKRFVDIERVDYRTWGPTSLLACCLRESCTGVVFSRHPPAFYGTSTVGLVRPDRTVRRLLRTADSLPRSGVQVVDRVIWPAAGG